MDDEKINRVLFLQNPFWKETIKNEYRERSIYPQILRVNKEKQIISLCGLRRTGKTTLLMKIISDLMEKNPADDILYFSFDDYDQQEIYPILDAFEQIHKKKPRYLVFDEVQKLPNWAEKIKILYDTGKYKIFVSGSESLFLKKGTHESLAGRIYEFEIKPLTFMEYLAFTNHANLATKPLLYEKELVQKLEKYIETAGFPELIGKPAPLAREYLRSAVINKIIYQDIPRIFPIEDASKLAAVLNIIIDQPGMLLELDSLSRELGISRQTLSKYVEYLENAHLVFRLYNYSRNTSTSEKRLKKIYPTFATPLLASNQDDATKGKILETVCARNTDAQFFWLNPQKDEVDVVLETKNGLLPIEVKRSNQPRAGKGLAKFCEKYACKDAIIVTKTTHKTEKISNTTTRQIPAWEFLLEPPQQQK